MAGVNYEVNIQLNAKTLDKQLSDLEKRVNNLKKNLAAPIRGQDQASRQSVARAEKAAKLEDRIRATRVITFNLGRRLNRLEERGIKVNEQRVQLNRAATSTNKKLVEQARTQNKLVREFVQAEERKLKLGVRAGRMQAENIDAAVSAREKRYSLDQKLRRLEEEGIKTDKLRSRFGDMNEARRKQEFGLFKQIARELELSVRRERDKLALQKRQTRELQRQARMRGAVSPIGGATFIPGSPAQIAASARTGGARSSIRGDINTPGSPAFIEAQQRELSRLARTGGARSPIQGSADIPGSPAFITAQAQERDKALRRAAQLGGARSSITGDVNTPGSPAFIKAQQAELIRLGRIGGARSAVDGSVDIPGSPAFIRAQARERQKALREAAAMGGPRSPIMGGVNMPGSPLAMQAARRRRSERLQGVALGAGFPLLFGGGPGSVLGGAAGGLVGGPAGFAAQIALSALGQQFDKFVGSTLEASKAFTSTSKAFEFVREKSLFSSQQIEARAIELEKQGKAEELAKLLTEELTTVIGTDGVKSLKLLGDETSEVTRLWGQLTLQLQALIAGPLTNFLKLVSQFVGGITLRSQFSALEQSVAPAQAKRLQEILTEKRGTRVISAQQQAAAFSDPRFQTAPITQSRGKQITVPGTITNEVLRQTLEQAAKEGIKAPATPLIPVTPLDRFSITPPKTKKGRRSRIPDLQAEQQKLQQLLGLERTMFELKRNDDDLGVRQLEHRMHMAELAEKEAKIRASDVPQKEKDLAISNLGLEAKRAELQLAYDIEQINKEAAQRAFEEMQNKIKQQNQLNKGMQQQLQLAQQVSDVLGQGMTRSFDLLITGANNWGIALRDIAANVLRDIARQLIQIYVIEQAVGFMRNLMSPTSSLTAPGGRYEGQAGALAPKPPPLPPLPKRALGGAVSAGKPYMVGERGPELFIPGAQGSIVPNHGMGGSNIVVNVDATGTQVQGDQPNANKLGEALGAAVRAELIRQKRPGGLLA